MTQPLPLLDDTNRFFWTSGSDGVGPYRAWSPY